VLGLWTSASRLAFGNPRRTTRDNKVIESRPASLSRKRGERAGFEDGWWKMESTFQPPFFKLVSTYYAPLSKPASSPEDESVLRRTCTPHHHPPCYLCPHCKKSVATKPEKCYPHSSRSAPAPFLPRKNKKILSSMLDKI